jgi:hypothetical protein
MQKSRKKKKAVGKTDGFQRIKEKILEPINPRDISIKAQDKFNIFKNTRFAHYNDFQWELLLNKYN